MNELVPVDAAPTTVFSINPLVTPRHGRAVAVGMPCGRLQPATPLPLLLKVNGRWISRAHWELVVTEPGDVVEWHGVLQGTGTSRGILQLVLIVAAVAYGAYTGDWKTAVQIYGYGSLALSLINVLVPIRQPNKGATTSPGSIYNASLAGNQARLNDAIPVIYGRMRTLPDFAAQPYGEYSNNDSYFYAVYCIGQGDYTVERLDIANSPIASFSDVQYEILAPGALPTLALANVYSAPEAAGQDLLTNVTVGAFAACPPGLQVTAVGIDVIFQSGLASADSSGNLSSFGVTFLFEAQAIDDFGTAAGDWFTLDTPTVTRATLTPQRVSFKYALAAPARVQVRFTRSSTFQNNMNVQNSPTLGGLRGYLNFTAALSSTATHLAVRIKASQQLTQFSQSRIAVVVRRKVRTWSPGGGWAAESETRNPAWALADLWSNAVYGDGLPDNRIDLATLYTLSQTWDTRQDRLDILFDTKIMSWDAAQTIAQSGRARPFRRGNVNTLARDQLQTLPVTAFTSRNMLPGLDMNYLLANETTADGVILEYFSNRTWTYLSVLCAAPGVVTPVNAPRVRLQGITGATHAQREGLYQAAQNLYRRKLLKWQTELTGLLPTYGSLVLFAPDLPGWGQSGDVVDWNPVTLVLSLSEPAVFTPGALAHYVSLVRDDGSVTNQIAVTPGPTANDLQLPTVPDFALVLDDGTRERPKYVFGAVGQHRIPALVLGVAKKARDNNGVDIVELNGVAENVLVHGVDNALLPGPGVIQDPVSAATAIPVFSYSTIVNLDAIRNKSLTPVNGITISGLDPTWTMNVDLPAAQLYTGWSEWASDYDSFVPSPPNAWGNTLSIYAVDTAVTTTIGSMAIASSGELARQAFPGGSVTGSRSYTLWIHSDAINDNRGGLSPRLTKV